MAGIIVGLGDEANQHFEEIRQAFESGNGLKASWQFSGKKCRVIKYNKEI